MNKRSTLIIIILAAALLATAAMAQGRGDRSGRGWDKDAAPGPEMRLDRMQERLDLTDEQRGAIEKIFDDARTEAADLRKEQARLRNRIEGEMLADEPSEQELVTLVEQLGDLRTEMQVNRLKTRLAVRAQLTDEQQDLWNLPGRRDRCDRSGPRQGRRSNPRNCRAM